MNTENISQPESGAQEAAETPVANKLGQLDEHSLSDLLKSGFLDEEEAAPALEGQQKDEPETVEDSLSDDVPQEEEGESDQPEADESSLTKGVQKRINKLVAAKKAAQAELEAHKQKLAQLANELQEAKMQSSASAPVEYSDYVESLDTTEKLQEEYKKTVDYLLWCEENPDGGVIVLPDGTQKELTDKQVRSAKSVFIKRKDIELPARLQFLQNQQVHDQQVLADFPWFSKPETEEYRMAQVVVRDFPEIRKRRPDWKHIVGLLVTGAKSHMESKSSKKPAPIKKAPAQPSISKAPPSSASSVNDLAKAKARFVKDSSDQQGIKDLVKAMGFV